MVNFGSVMRGVMGQVLVVSGPNCTYNIEFYCSKNAFLISAHIFSVSILHIKGGLLYWSPEQLADALCKLIFLQHIISAFLIYER